MQTESGMSSYGPQFGTPLYPRDLYSAIAATSGSPESVSLQTIRCYSHSWYGGGNRRGVVARTDIRA